MDNKRFLTLICCFLLAPACGVWAQGTAFTYQGQLEDDGSPASGIYDLRFTIYDSSGGPTVVAGPLTNAAVEVVNGLFTVTLDFGSGVFTGPARWLDIGVQTNGGGGFTTLSPRTEVTASPYAIFAGTVSTVPLNSVGSPEVINNSLTASDLAANSVTASEIATGAVGTSEVLDGSLTTADINLGSFDARYVEVAGDTMTGKLTANGGIATSLITNNSGLLSLKSTTDIELTIDNGGGASAAFEIFNGVGSHLFLVSEFGNARVFEDLTVDGTIFSSEIINSSGIFQLETGSDFEVLLDRQGSATSYFEVFNGANTQVFWVNELGNARIYGDLTLDESLISQNPTTPALFVYPSGTSNPNKPVISHSPGFPEYGLWYVDTGDRFEMKSSAADTTPSLVVDLDSNWVTIATDTPKPGYELSVNGQIVCEELLVEDSADWPDYVFDPEYRLASLEAVEAHIKARKHLPGIPSAEEVKRDGLPIGEMQKRMMEKIEELTLYAIEQNKRLAEQDDRIRQLEAQVSNLEAR